MKVPFRQGIIRARTVLSSPAFLEKSGTGTSVHLRVTQTPVVDPLIVTFAHYDANYLLEETSQVFDAWGSGNAPAGGQNGPLSPGQNQFLYWDIDDVTGERRFGWTPISPVIAASAPAAPANGLHWFDTTQTVMKVRENGTWKVKIRVFAGIYDSAGIVSEMPIGLSQVGITGSFFAGNILFGGNDRPLRQRNGNVYTFTTTESVLKVGFTSGQNVKFDAAVVFGRALEPIEKYSLVSFQAASTLVKASSNNLFGFVSGLVVEDLHINETGQVLTNGKITTETWKIEPLGGDIGRPLPPLESNPDYWLIKNHVNKPIFCNDTGQLTLIPPVVGVVQQVGFVADNDAIFLNLFPPVRLR